MSSLGRLSLAVVLGLDRRQLNHLRGPVLAQAFDQVAVKDEQGDLPHPLADVLYPVVKLGFPLGDRRVAVQVQVQQLTFDVALACDDLGLPVVADAIAAQDRRPQDALVVGGAGGEDGRDQLGVLLGPGANVDVQDLTNLLLGQRHQGSSTTAVNGRGASYWLCFSISSCRSRGSRSVTPARPSSGSEAGSSRTHFQGPIDTSTSLS